MEKKLVLLSNSDNVDVNNTLCHFKNQLHDTNYLPNHKKWNLRVEYIGFHPQFKNQVTSDNNNHPAIIVTSVYEFLKKSNVDLTFPIDGTLSTNAALTILRYTILDLSFFDDHEKFHLDENMSYSISSMDRHFSKKIRRNSLNDPGKYRGYFANIKEGKMQFSQFYFPFMNFHADETWMLRTIIFFHEKFAKCFSNFEDITYNGSLKIDNETYFWIFNAELKSPLKVSFLKEKIELKIPNVIKILSKNIKPVFSQETYSNEIAKFPFNEFDINKYFHKTFSSLEYFSTDTTNQTQFEIILADRQ